MYAVNFGRYASVFSSQNCIIVVKIITVFEAGLPTYDWCLRDEDDTCDSDLVKFGWVKSDDGNVSDGAVL